MQDKKQTGTWKKVLGYISRYKVLLFITLLLAFTSVVLTLYIPIIVGNAIDLIVEMRKYLTKYCLCYGKP